MRVKNIKLYMLGHNFAYEMECVLRLFFPGSKIAVLSEEPSGGGDMAITRVYGNNDIFLSAGLCVSGNSIEDSARLPNPASEAEQERALAALLFGILVELTGIRPPWGVLTGVRPVRFCRNLARSVPGEEGVFKALTEQYLVTPKKARLAIKTCGAAGRILDRSFNKAFSLYISIPFCPSRCLYCSFVSSEIESCLKLIPDYVGLLCEEIRCAAKIAEESGLSLHTVYIGGGTPTTLDARDLSVIMDAVNESFDISRLFEYTVEAGRPETITEEKLFAIKSRGVSRLSINPQTMDDKVLMEIGRNHTSAEFIQSFRLARELGFSCINSDIIAGLPGDTDAVFIDSIGKLIQLAPENITLHTLTVKRASALRERDDAYNASGMDVGASLDAAGEMLSKSGYFPYYMYRQKGTPGNHENTGYSKPGSEGVYNVYIMEDEHTVLAVGAGAVSKICLPGGEIRRIYNYKHPHEYISRFGEVSRRKSEARELLKKV